MKNNVYTDGKLLKGEPPVNQHQIACLCTTAPYPEPTSTVQHLQTHISHIFLTDQYAYKVKKPVDFGFLDFSSLEKRCFYCHEELRLNRRLSPDIYLDVVVLRDDGQGGITFSGNGMVCEYAVKMRRMPAGQIMARLLEQDAVTPQDITLIAEKVAGFHAAAARDAAIAAFGAAAVIKENWDENLRQLRPYIDRTLSGEDYRLISGWVSRRLEHDKTLLEQRMQQGYIRDCDGDLHSENICLDGQVHIFDCIEFNEKFRYSDTAADVAFLAMDLENHGRRDLAVQFVADYQAASGDNGLNGVLSLYLVNRAVIRGKVESFRLDDPLISTQEKEAAAERACRFFRLARGYIVREHLVPTLFMTCGLTGCGKSAVASELAFQLGIEHISSDRERKRLAGVATTERNATIYTKQWNRTTYQELYCRGAALLTQGRSVILDATFRSRQERRLAIELADSCNARAVIIFPDCPETLIRQRLAERQQRGDAVSDGTWEVYLTQVQQFELPSADEALLLRPDTSLPVCKSVDTVLSELGLLQQKEK